MTRLLASSWLTSRRFKIVPFLLHQQTVRSMASRTYADAVMALNSLQSNFAIVDAIRKSGKKMNEQAIPEMVEWARKIGYKPSDLNVLRPIHIAGTKGKGSTAAFVSSSLNTFRAQVGGLDKVGLYTSPHLRFVRERIQINDKPLSEEQFARYFFQVWDKLEYAAREAGVEPTSPEAKPVYFRFLTLMAFHTYISEGVDVAIIECGIGGAYDSTNIIERPSVTAITNLGIDHVGVLGGTIDEIAWHKAGVMKKGVKCFTPSSQPEAAKAVLGKQAAERAAELVYVNIDPAIASGQISLGLQADFQKTNASLAVAIAYEFLRQANLSVNTSIIHHGLESTAWPGRCDTRLEPGIRWCIDGGHTLDSINLAGKWFADQLQKASSSSQPQSYLIFNQQTRDAPSLARALHSTLSTTLDSSSSDTPTVRPLGRPFDKVIFCTNTTYVNSGFKPDLISVNTNKADVDEMKVQKELAKVWAELDPDAEVEVVRTVEEAVGTVRGDEVGEGHEKVVLVTGSLHLVGGVLEVLEGEKEERS